MIPTLAAALVFGTLHVWPTVKQPPISPEDRICSLNVSDQDVGKTLSFISQQTHTNLILLTDPPKHITLRLDDVKLKDVVRHICAASGLSSLEVDGAYVFASPDQLRASYPLEYDKLHPPVVGPAQVEPTFEIIRPQYSDVEKLADTLFGMFRSEHLTVVTGGGSAMPAGLPKDGDIPEVDFQNNGARPAVSPVAPPAGIDPGALGSGVRISGGGKSILLYGDPAVLARAVKVAKLFDVAPIQVSIQVTVYEVSNDALKDLGLTYNFGQFTISENPSNFNVGHITRGGLNVDVAIQALQTSQKARVIASPNIAAIDGTTSTLLIGQELNFPDLIGYSNANTPIFGTRKVEAGISLQVAPIVADDGTITMEIRPKVSTVTGFLQVNGASYPQLSSRKAQATVRVMSGGSIVLGGLMNSSDIDNMQKVPILGDLPILGALFQSHKKTHSNSQLVITITPKVLKG